MECPARKVTLVHGELLDQLVRRELKALKERRVPQDLRDQKVQPGRQAPVALVSNGSQQLLQIQLHIVDLVNGRSGFLKDQIVFHPDRMLVVSQQSG